MTSVQEIIGALASVRGAEGMNDAGNAALVAREKALVAELIRAPAATSEDAAAKARELAHLLEVGDFGELWPTLATALIRDIEQLAE